MTNIRKAAPAEAAVLTQIAQDAKRHWGYPESWIEHWKENLTITAEFIAENEVYVTEVGSRVESGPVPLAEDGPAAIANEIAGFYAIVTCGQEAELEHMWVKPEHIGTGVGRDLFMHALETAAFLNAAALEISADPNAEGFYKRMGARRIGEVHSEIEGQPRTLPRLAIDLDRPAQG